MTKDTHLASGLAVSVALIRPTSFKSLAICLASAAIGSLISDIDITTSKSRKDLNIIILVSVISIALCTLVEAVFHIGILSLLESETNITRILLGLGFILFICCFGINTPHRTFMHSLLCVIALCGMLWIIFPAMVLPFGIGMISHICLDFLNTKKVQVLWPLKKPRIAFKICRSESKMSRVICGISSAIIILELILFAILQAVAFAKEF